MQQIGEKNGQINQKTFKFYFENNFLCDIMFANNTRLNLFFGDSNEKNY